MRKILIGTAAMAALAVGAMQAQASPRSEARQRALTEAKPIGEPVDCVQLTNIRETRVRSDNVIDFIMRSGKTYRNTLPNSCPRLGFEERFAYKTSLSQLCSVDIITVLEEPGVSRGASCGLGKFQPIELPKR